MNKEETIIMFGKISIQLIYAIGMHAENMQRQVLGDSMAYGEADFGEIADIIENIIKGLDDDSKT